MAKHHIIKHFFLSILAGVLISCSGNGSPYFADIIDIDYYLRVSPSTIYLEGEESASFTITSNVNSWEITGKPDWLTINNISGKGNATVTVYATANTTGDDRTAFLTIKSPANDVTVTITQKKKIFSVSPTQISFEAVGSKQTLKISSAQSWSINYTASWLSVDKKSGTGDDNVTITVAENVTTQARETDIAITSGTESVSIKISQKGIIYAQFVNTWVWDTSVTGTVWGNMGYCGGDGADVGTKGNGQWWGAVAESETETGAGNGFLQQLQHSDTGVATGEESMDAYMIFTSEGKITSYDKEGVKIRGGNYYVERIDNNTWKAANLHTDPGSILWPFEINSGGNKPTVFEVVYITEEKMTLVYPDGGDFESLGGWGEATFWHFAKKGTIENNNKPGSGDNQPPVTPAREINNN